ncbi:hypothetical protein GE061_008675 [Apolygus lucorum]|uniref:MYND-type domain-containing protein n=1 Tax=Apolygus lucorum TaxID=248454 RepID=A0A8S9WN97_APOLU|nr:hypothetical protein GE061_008675 [Apolygus lucorum]
MPKGKDLTHLGREMERAWDERRSRSSSPVSRPALPRGRSRSPVATRFTRVRQSIDVEYEWSVLWSGAEKMYHATSATNRNAGWQRFESAAEILRRHMADLTTAAQAVPKTEDIAAELVRQLNQSQSPPCDPVEIARTVAGMMTARPRTPPVINMAELARLISENLKIERAPPYSPIVDVTRITNLVEERLEAKQKAAAQHPTSLSETAEVSELTADLPPLRLSTSSTSEDESTTVVQPATITPIEQSASTSTTRPAATAKASRKSDRRCLACGKARAHNSRLWCEACRMFLVRAKKAAETDKPYTCVVTSHNNKPDTTNCRGCRLLRDGSPQGTRAESPALTTSCEDSEPLIKLKRLLITMVSFCRELSPERGDKLSKAVLQLVGGTLNLEDFLKTLHDATKAQPKPYVHTYLRLYLPFLHKEMTLMARNSKLSVQDYLTAHPSVVLDPEFSPCQHSEVFNLDVKRRYQECSLYEEEYSAPPPKRPMLVPVHPLASQSTSLQPSTRTSDEEQWRNIHVMLNCILSMVEKTKAAISILQGRSQDEAKEEVRRSPAEVMAQTIRMTEDRVAQVKKKAEEAVAEIKRKAMAELQRAVSAAEIKATQLVTAEKLKLDKIFHQVLTDARRADETLAVEPQNSCWNCGRKAEETCSGCNVAKYCGSFCQRKDWDSHHTSCRPKDKPKGANR